MEIFDLLYYVTLFFIPIAPYFIFFKHTTNGRFYTNRDWLYLFKLLVATPAIKKYQRKCRQSLDEGTRKSLENPKKIKSDIYDDNHFIYGVDQNGNSLSLRITLRANLVAEVFLCLRLTTGAIYTFPGEKITRLYSISSWRWKTKDLHVEILEPFKRLRVTYNGLLSNATHDVEHVRFSFIWVAAGAPQFYPQDAATGLLADALARHPWRDGSWISLLGDERGYEQFGALKGFVKGDSFADDLLLNLPSCRTRYWCTAEKLAMQRSVHLFVAGRDGALISLWIKELQKGCKELQYGNVIMNNGKVSPISSSDVRLEFLGQQRSLPSAFTIHVQANKKTYRTVFHLKTKKTITTSIANPDYLAPELSNTPADCDLNTQQAKSLVEFWYRGKSETRDQLPPPLITENKTQHLPSCYVTNFDDDDAKIVRLTGGKGCSLALLTSLKSDDFVVPGGFVVTVNAFNKQLDVNFNMKKTVAILDDICCGRTSGDLELACSLTVKTVQSEAMLPEIADAIIRGLRHVRKDAIISEEAWAVRSSAIGEDSEELSAAGQNETFLGCTTPDDVIKSVSACWASLFTYQSVKYRHQHGLPIATQMAVVVQRMIPADCAGVLFTCHPSTGSPAQIVITANHGLGESVVSGRSEPDTVILERTCDNDVTIKSKALGSKKTMIKMVEGGVEEVDGVEEFSVTDNQALELGRVGVLLEEKFGGARDIEWGYFQGRLFLLQARPITTLHTWSNFELTHEYDVATLSEDMVYSIANTGEVLPGAICVLTLSTLVRCLDTAIQRGIEDKDDPYAFKCLSTFQHHLFIDVISGVHRRVEKTITLSQKILDLAIFGHPIIDENIHSLALARFGVTSGREQLRELLIAIKIAWRNEDSAKLSKYLAKTIDINIDKERDTLKDIYVKINDVFDTVVQLVDLHCCTTRTSITYQIFAMMVLAEGRQDFTTDHYNDVAMLLASCDEVVSAEIPNSLANITTILVKSNQVDEFVKVPPHEGEKWLKNNSPEASDALDKFLKNHGHRGVREFDMYYKTWGLNPSDVIKMIQTNCKNPTSRQEKVTKSVNDVIAALVTPKKFLTRKILKFLVTKSRRAVGLREQTKSETIRFVNKVRTAYTFLGHKMALAGLIPDADLIYHLTHYEIGQILGGCDRSPVLIIKALKRQKLYPKWDHLKFPEVSYGVPRHESRDFIPRTGVGKVKCEGTPVCAGVVQARACVITDLSEIDQLREGDVLITYCTDIGWSPYFPMLGGIVTELGGLVSHGAVIAREYGLPCIVGAKGATKTFKTGDNVVLSGKTGTIELI
ncbi:hypothetical protein Zmor_017373 [Zophobas morio]|uniref:Phosphoenolpyruvate synthase n=1 Tax=Zophobas morio TaxID=2755281 RepID=A0AA38IB28_9CUCU|nr:hypothetical protein Zmor_016809 [Zophobas morio]KAJ3651323.1 hypothetical protein Zmor_017373 [Zophobas morio]